MLLRQTCSQKKSHQKRPNPRYIYWTSLPCKTCVPSRRIRFHTGKDKSNSQNFSPQIHSISLSHCWMRRRRQTLNSAKHEYSCKKIDGTHKIVSIGNVPVAQILIEGNGTLKHETLKKVRGAGGMRVDSQNWNHWTHPNRPHPGQTSGHQRTWHTEDWRDFLFLLRWIIGCWKETHEIYSAGNIPSSHRLVERSCSPEHPTLKNMLDGRDRWHEGYYTYKGCR